MKLDSPKSEKDILIGILCVWFSIHYTTINTLDLHHIWEGVLGVLGYWGDWGYLGDWGILNSVVPEGKNRPLM